jgi:prevent-host-death family protein
MAARTMLICSPVVAVAIAAQRPKYSFTCRSRRAAVLDRAAAGEEIVIARAGRPVARLVALAGAARQERTPGAWRGKVRIAADSDHLPAEIEAAFRGDGS